MTKAVQVVVEFYGVARQRAGTDRTLVSCLPPVRLADLLGELSGRFPDFARTCLDGNRLNAGYVACLDGDELLNDPERVLDPGLPVLIVSADSGG